MTVLCKLPKESWKEIEIENTLEALQAEVDGPIETIQVFSDGCFIVNEEGKLRGLVFNTLIRGEPIVGTILLVGIDGDKFCSLPCPSEVIRFLNKGLAGNQ